MEEIKKVALSILADVKEHYNSEYSEGNAPYHVVVLDTAFNTLKVLKDPEFIFMVKDEMIRLAAGKLPAYVIDQIKIS